MRRGAAGSIATQGEQISSGPFCSPGDRRSHWEAFERGPATQRDLGPALGPTGGPNAVPKRSESVRCHLLFPDNFRHARSDEPFVISEQFAIGSVADVHCVIENKIKSETQRR